MANPKMVILRGNAAKAGHYPDEQGKTIAWPIGALHVKAASDYAKRRGYDPIVLDVSGYPQSQHSPQAKAALKAFHEDESVAAFYGFSGGGYNLRHILEYIATNEPQSLRRIKLVVVIGAPFNEGKKIFVPSRYNALVSKEAKGDSWQAADWEVIYRENPKKSQMPRGLEDVGTHMFGPDALLAGWPEG
ncbi:MAG TPA: hypothetical protein PLM32_13320 [Candidatus Competibacter sp.]|nr:hypothetical protein [Candidatus Competibacter sp.]